MVSFKGHYEVPLSMITYVSLLSLSGHKEHRFLFGVYPLIAIAMVMAVSFVSKKGLCLVTTLCLFIGGMENTSAFRNNGMYKDMGSIHLAEFIRTFNKPVSDAVLFYGCYNSPLNSVVHKYSPLYTLDPSAWTSQSVSPMTAGPSWDSRKPPSSTSSRRSSRGNPSCWSWKTPTSSPK